jgi:hypothetical protein
MPTVMDPKVTEEPKLQPVTPASAEPELFAAEIEMERKSSNFLPLVFILGLVVAVGGGIFYFVKSTGDVLTVPVATNAVSQILKDQGPSTVRFSTGTVVSSINEKPLDPHYKLLAKAGIVTTKPKGYNSLIVALNPAGEKLLSEIGGVQKSTNLDKTVTYLVPLAERKLLAVNNVTMIRPHVAKVEYTWKWVPNRLGKEFDASGELVKSFVTWDRATLIKSYGVDFYGADATKATIVLMEGKDGGWKPYTE